MSHPYFFIDAGNIGENKIKIGGEDLNHLKNVLRSKIGDLVYISDNREYKYKTEISDISKSEVILEIKDKKRIVRKSPRLVLFQCILKKNSMEFVIQKSTEIGVDEIVPIISGRIAVDIKKISPKIERWQKISDGASKQSKRDYKCEVLAPRDIYGIKVSEYDLFYIPYEKSTGDYKNLAETLRTLSNISSIGFIIGPEGGFEASELSFLKESGGKEIKLGGNIYRSETAAIYFLSVLDYLIGSQK